MQTTDVVDENIKRIGELYHDVDGYDALLDVMKLPVYLQPEKIVFVKELPTNSNGKVDYSKL